jgi:hypothetical protein
MGIVNSGASQALAQGLQLALQVQQMAQQQQAQQAQQDLAGRRMDFADRQFSYGVQQNEAEEMQRRSAGMADAQLASSLGMFSSLPGDGEQQGPPAPDQELLSFFADADPVIRRGLINEHIKDQSRVRTETANTGRRAEWFNKRAAVLDQMLMEQKLTSEQHAWQMMDAEAVRDNLPRPKFMDDSTQRGGMSGGAGVPSDEQIAAALASVEDAPQNEKAVRTAAALGVKPTATMISSMFSTAKPPSLNQQPAFRIADEEVKFAKQVAMQAMRQRDEARNLYGSSTAPEVLEAEKALQEALSVHAKAMAQYRAAAAGASPVQTGPSMPGSTPQSQMPQTVYDMGMSVGSSAVPAKTPSQFINPGDPEYDANKVPPLGALVRLGSGRVTPVTAAYIDEVRGRLGASLYRLPESQRAAALREAVLMQLERGE